MVPQGGIAGRGEKPDGGRLAAIMDAHEVQGILKIYLTLKASRDFLQNVHLKVIQSSTVGSAIAVNFNSLINS
jgi:hypothetical protein